MVTDDECVANQSAGFFGQYPLLVDDLLQRDRLIREAKKYAMVRGQRARARAERRSLCLCALAAPWRRRPRQLRSACPPRA